MRNETRLAVVGRTERRRSRRYRPPSGFSMELKGSGFLGFLCGNFFKACINLSEGGIRALVSRAVKEGETLHGQLMMVRGVKPLEVTLRVQFAVPSGSSPACWEAGLRFVDPSPELARAVKNVIASPALSLGSTTRSLRRDAWGEAR